MLHPKLEAVGSGEIEVLILLIVGVVLMLGSSALVEEDKTEIDGDMSAIL